MRTTLHFFTVAILGPFLAVVGDDIANHLDYGGHGIAYFISKGPGMAVFAASIDLPLLIFFGPLAAIYFALFRRFARNSLAIRASLAASLVIAYPLVALIVVHIGHYVVSYALYGSVAAALMISPLLYYIWTRESKNTET